MRSQPTHDLLGSGSLHASTISGGEEISMYPAHCKLLVERRTIPGETLASVAAETQAILDEIAAQDQDFKAQVKATFARGPFNIAAAHPLCSSSSGLRRRGWIVMFSWSAAVGGWTRRSSLTMASRQWCWVRPVPVPMLAKNGLISIRLRAVMKSIPTSSPISAAKH